MSPSLPRDCGKFMPSPSAEGNTRTTAVFIIRYLRTMGFEVNNDMFAEHAWYFRNALVRANYNDYLNQVHATVDFLVKFGTPAD